MKKIYLQYGCGWSAPEGWRNFDASPTLRFERIKLIGKLYTKNKERFPDKVEYGDIVKGLPIDNESCDGIYCSHVLEHLSLEEFRVALKNTNKYLKPGGIFRLVLPDLEYSIKNYINDESPEAAKIFLEETYLGVKKRNRGLRGLIFSMLSNSDHLWMWDFKSIKAELEKHGFIKIKRAYYRDSLDLNFNNVEEESRWKNSLGVECIKNNKENNIK
jgi:predicted SAM-dependent methyltransferase